MGLELFYGAFLDLSTCRPSGWGLCAIPWTVIHDYASANRLMGDEREDLFFHIRKMDDAYMEYHKSKTDKESKLGSKGHGKLGRSEQHNAPARQTNRR